MNDEVNLDRVFAAMCNSTRRAILAKLAQGERSTGVIAKEFSLSRPTISKHLGVLKDAGLVKRRHEGRNQIYTLDTKPLAAARQWLLHYEEFWHHSLGQLQRHIEETK